MTLVGLVAGVMSVVVLSAVPGSAASPNSTTGTADCGSAGSYTFSASGNHGQGTSWNVAFVTAPDGSRALFHPTSFDFTFIAPDGTVVGSESTAKHHGSGPVTCTILGHPMGEPGATLTGTVTGWLTPLPSR
jgi:hypothetical protein